MTTNYKKRILFVNEFSKLATGFSTYGYELISRVYQTGEFEICEYASYLDPTNPLQYEVPWDVVPVIPHPNDHAAMKEYNSVKDAQFGSLKFADVCMKFKPDFVFDLRDRWMASEWEEKHPFRPYFKYIYMPCIDGEPQKPEWIESYRKADVRTSYSEWAANIMRNAGMSVEAITYPGSNPDVFKPVSKTDKEDIRSRLGFPPDAFIIQTVMRNQPRKLYPDLLRTFKRFLQVCQESGRNEIADKTFLHLHTYLNDVGFDIAAEIQRYHLGHKVLLTYQDMETKQYEVSFYKGIHPTFLRSGKKPVSITPNTGGGLDKTQLAELMGVADLYVQYSVAGACEMPIIDAKSCGIPVMAPAYAAMAEQMIDGGGIPLKVARFYQEGRNETSQRRALPDEEYAAQAIYKFFNAPQTYRDELGEQARRCVLSKYTWDGCADKWLKIFRETDILDRNLTWDSPAFIHQPNLDIPSVMSDEHFVELAYQHIVGRPWVLSWETKRGIVNLLKIGTWNQNGKEVPFNRTVLVQQLIGLNTNINQLEVARANHGKPQKRPDNSVGFISI